MSLVHCILPPNNVWKHPLYNTNTSLSELLFLAIFQTYILKWSNKKREIKTSKTAIFAFWLIIKVDFFHHSRDLKNNWSDTTTLYGTNRVHVMDEGWVVIRLYTQIINRQTMMKRCSAPDPGAIYSHVSSWGSGGWLGGFSPAVAWPVTGPGNRQRAGRGTAWCLGQGLAQILQCQAGPSLHGDHQPHNCDTGQHQCSQTSTVWPCFHTIY